MKLFERLFFVTAVWVLGLTHAGIAMADQSADMPPPVVPSGVPARPERFECGNYLIRGVLKEDSGEVEILELYPKTSRHFDLVLRGISLTDQGTLANASVEVEAYIYQSGRGVEARAKVIKSPQPVALFRTLEQPIRLLKKRGCFED